jgi:hypothetical protein
MRFPYECGAVIHEAQNVGKTQCFEPLLIIAALINHRIIARHRIYGGL